MPPTEVPQRYRMADLLIDLGRRSVLRGATEIHLPKLSFDVLRTLIEAAPNVVSNEQLARAVWQPAVVSPETVTQRVKVLRDALGDDPAAPRYIAGLRGQGYRILPDVSLDSVPCRPMPLTPSSAAPGPAWPDGRESVVAEPRLRSPAILLAVAALAAALTYLAIDVARNTRQVPSRSESPRPTASAREVPRRSAFTMTQEPFSPPSNSVAVLPFINMSNDPRQEYFSEGISEELLNSLSRVNELQVAARTSSFSFKGRQTDITTIARSLNVRSILEGSVRRSGRTIRITAQLNDALTGFHVWSQTYDRNLGDVLQLQREIAESVTRALKVTLLGDVATKIGLGGTRNPAALDAYLRASKAYWTHRSGQDIRTAIAAFSEAIRLDPDYALAYSGRSLAEMYLAGTADIPAEPLAKAESDARQAVALAPDLGEGHIALAGVYVLQLRFTPASEEYDRALALAPGSARVLRDCGGSAIDMGRGDAGLAILRRAVLLDPLNPESYAALGVGLYTLRRYSEAIAAYKEAEVLKGDSPEWGYAYGYAYYLLGDLQSARTSCDKDPDPDDKLFCLAVVDHKQGRDPDAQARLSHLKASHRDGGAYQYAEIYAQWGDIARALQWLDTAMRLHDPGLAGLKMDPFMDPLRKEPRFQAIERALNFPK